MNQDQIVYSIDRVKRELLSEGDQLSNWAANIGSEFFLRTDGRETQSAITAVANWAAGSGFTIPAQQKFLSGADFMLVGHAIAGGFTVVTFEVSAPNAKSAIKLPDACAHFGVGCTNLFKLRNALRNTHPMRLILDGH